MTKPEVKAFLQKYELDAEQIDMTQELGHMLEAMSIGLLPDQEADRLAKLYDSLPLATLAQIELIFAYLHLSAILALPVCLHHGDARSAKLAGAKTILQTLSDV